MNKTYNIDTCDIYITQKILKSKWVVLVIHALYEEVLSFNQLLESILYISNTQLSKTLSTLKKEKIISKDDLHIYNLTTKGKDLYYLTKEMQKWSRKYS